MWVGYVFVLIHVYHPAVPPLPTTSPLVLPCLLAFTFAFAFACLHYARAGPRGRSLRSILHSLGFALVLSILFFSFL